MANKIAIKSGESGYQEYDWDEELEPDYDYSDMPDYDSERDK